MLCAVAALLFAAVLLLCMLTNWAAVYNVDIDGNEARITGYHCVASGLSGNYTVPNTSSYGDMAVPFYMYAQSCVLTLCKLSIAVMFVVIAHILFGIFTVIARKKLFFVLSAVFSLAEAALFIACYATAQGMNDSQIVPIWCSGNPACSIQSNAIIPAVLAILSLAIPVFVLIKFRNKKSEKGKSAQGKPEQKKGQPQVASEKTQQKAHPRATAFKGNRYKKG